NTEMIEFLVERKADTSRSILECTSHYNEIKKDAIEILVKNGAYIDTLNYMGVTPMYSAMLNYARNLSRMIDYKEKDENRYNKAKEDVENYKDMLQFFVSKGANPLSMNKQGDDFRAILKTQIGRTALTKHAIVEKVEEFFYPNPTKKNPTPEQDTSNSEKKYPKWQFWRRF
ncbi:MAG: hypothetical protein P1U56_24860, partial [Saprospiraceae bacterium]|nr:hypothetical protein [Saprospiraceae bacterium]